MAMCKPNTLSQVILDDRILIGPQNSKSDSPTGSNISGTSGFFRSLLSGSQRSTKVFIYTSPPFLLPCVICHFLHHSENQLTWSSALVSSQLFFHSAPNKSCKGGNKNILCFLISPGTYSITGPPLDANSTLEAWVLAGASLIHVYRSRFLQTMPGANRNARYSLLKNLLLIQPSSIPLYAFPFKCWPGPHFCWAASFPTQQTHWVGRGGLCCSWKWKSLSLWTTWTIHGTLQARILEWVAIPFSGGSSQPRGQTQVSHIAGAFFTSWATREALCGPCMQKLLVLQLCDLEQVLPCLSPRLTEAQRAPPDGLVQ